MKVTLNWLKKYVDFDWSPEELGERLTMLGLEVEAIETLGGEFAGVVVAQVLTREKHPNADKLSVCRVTDGSEERQIVCGAQNFKAGDKVPLVLPGATLQPSPDEKPFTIKASKIRGVESFGMMCSGRELGLSDDHEGLMILSADAPLGQPFAAFLGRAESDVLYDLEVTPNRPDLNSVIGIAREIAAATGNPLRLPSVELAGEAGTAAGEMVEVRLEAPDLCGRYNARIIRGVRVGSSPDWLRQCLEKVGLRSINNVVDVTNFVMLETGQPLHAFDHHLVARGKNGKPAIIVRRAAEGEPFTTLDGQEHRLTGDMLLIADEEKGIALAGVMGGLNTEIRETTTDVLLECAWFAPAGIRRTAKALGLRTDASYRFERGADIGICDWASRRCAQLILETAGGQADEGAVDAMAEPIRQRQVTVRHQKVNELLGIELQAGEIDYYLGQLGLKKAVQRPAAVDASASRASESGFIIPTFRVDLKREADLIEEVCRLHGVDKIPATPPRGAIGHNDFDGVHDQLAEARRLLSGLGLDEAQGQTLIAAAAAHRVVAPEAVMPLEHPLSSDMNVLRPSLLPGMLDALRHNVSRKNNDVALFEIGRVFLAGGEPPREQRRLAIALTGQRDPAFWSGADRGAKYEVLDLKGLLEEFLEQFGLRGVAWNRRASITPLFCESAEVRLGGRIVLGELGQVMPPLAREYDLRDPVFLAELDLDVLLARRNAARSFKALPQYPSSRRDIAMFVPETVTHEDIVQAIRKARATNLETVEIFDVFRGRNVPEGQKSVAYACVYRSPEKTLTDPEVNTAHERVVEQLRRDLHVAIRDT